MNEKYAVVRSLGKGGSSSVFLVRHRLLGAERAMKRINKEHVQKEWFLKEAYMLKNLRHPNIPILYDIEEDEDYYYLYEEYIPGESLRAYRLSQINFSERTTINFAIQICEILIFLHSLSQPIWHLDLKPENIIVTENYIKIIDFGSSMYKNEQRRLSFGTKGYAAPEQFGLHQVDGRTDIYGAGALMFFLVTGQGYTGNKNDVKILKTIRCSENLKRIIQRCLRYLPIQRYSSAINLKKELEHLQGKICAADKGIRTPQVYNISGMFPRAGVTHICLMMTLYFNRMGNKALYVEVADHQTVYRLKENGITSEICPMACGGVRDVMERYSDYEFYICDYGTMRENRIEEFPESRNFLVMGGSPWEPLTVQTIEKTEYLINLAGKEEYRRVSNWYQSIKCIRVPYIPELFKAGDNEIEQEFMEEVQI